MAIITGMKPVDIADVKAFELPVEQMAKGLLSRQTRADEVKNTIGLGESALKIETRPFDEDMHLAKEIQDEYKLEWNKLLNDAQGDYSKVDNSQVQSLATKYAADDRVKYLTSAKKNYDVANEIQKKIRTESGEELMFGPINPLDRGLYGNDGNFLEFHDWDMEKRLDYTAKAQSLFKNIGHEIDDTDLYDPARNGSFYDFIVKRRTSHKDNIDEIDHIINNGKQMFKDSTEGIQYVKMKKQELLRINPTQSEKEMNETIDQYIFDMMLGIGKSQQILENKTILEGVHINKPEPVVKKSTGKVTGTGAEDKIVSVNLGDLPMTFSGMTLGGANNTPRNAANNIESESYQIDNFKELANNYNSVNNINALKDVALRVSNGGGGGEYGDKTYNPGVLYALDANLALSSFTGDANRTVIRIMNPDLKGGKTSEEIFNQKNKENLIVDFNDLKEIYPNKSEPELKQMIFGSSNIDGFMNLLDINTIDTEGTVDVGVNKIFLQLKINLEQKVANGDKFAQVKLDRLNKKLESSKEYMSVHAEDITKLKAKFYTLKQTANQYKRIDREAAEKAGLDATFIEKQEEFYKRDGKSGTYLGDVSDIFDNASLNAITNYMDSWHTRHSHGSPEHQSSVSYANTPKQLFKKIGKTEEGGKNILTGSPANRKGYDLYMGILQDFLDQDVNMSEVMTVVYGKTKASLGGTNDPMERNYILFKDYATRKLNQIKDLDPNVKTHLINAIAGVAGQFANVQQDNQGGPVTLNYVAGKSPTEIKETLAKNRSDEFNKIATGKNTKVSSQILNYLNNIKELKQEYILEKQKMWLLGGDSDASGWGDSLIRLREQLKVAVSNPSTLIKRVRWNKSGTNGNPTLSEEFNADDFQKIMDSYLFDERGNRKPGGEEAFYKDIFKGIVFDYDNTDKPFSAILSVSPKQGDAKIDLEVEISPDPLDLMMFGVQPLQYRYYNDIKKGMKNSDNSYFDLEFNGKKTRFFRAAYNIDDINKGEFYTIGSGDLADINNPNSKKEKIGTADAAIVYHTQRVTQGVNIKYVDQLKEIISDYKKNPRSLVDKWDFNEGDINKIQKALNDHLTTNTENETEDEGK
jgi:hypothetical protein